MCWDHVLESCFGIMFGMMFPTVTLSHVLQMAAAALWPPVPLVAALAALPSRGCVCMRVRARVCVCVSAMACVWVHWTCVTRWLCVMSYQQSSRNGYAVELDRSVQCSFTSFHPCLVRIGIGRYQPLHLVHIPASSGNEEIQLLSFLGRRRRRR